MSDTPRNPKYGDVLNCNASQEKEVYCICRSTVNNVFMIGCDFCNEWYHGDCIEITIKEAVKIDKYCCIQCRKRNPSLKTTYKTNTTRKKKRPSNESNNLEKVAKLTASQERQSVEAGSSTESLKAFSNTEMATVNLDTVTVKNASDFVDTTIRKAKIKAYQKFKQSTAAPQQITAPVKKKPEQEKVELRQCYGPSCMRASRNGSKYCSDECGITRAKSRKLEILSQRSYSSNRMLSVADENTRKQLANIRTQLRDIEKRLDELEIESTVLKNRIKESKNPTNMFVDLQCDDTTPTECILCGTEIQNKLIGRHLEQCFIRLERNTFGTEYAETSSDVEWNVFCNHKISNNKYCKMMKVLCPFHYGDSRRDHERCGYNLGKVNGVFQYCGNIGKTCCHSSWEEISIAELDIKKINLLFKYKYLKNEENKISSLKRCIY